MTRARILADYVSGGTTAAEFDYLDGVTSNVQTQMDLKAPLASPVLVTPNLGTPSAGVMTNVTGMPLAGLSATGTASATTYLRGDNSWQTAGSTSASDLDSGTLAAARMLSGSVVKQSFIGATDIASNIATTSTSFTDTGMECVHTTRLSSTDSYLIFDFASSMDYQAPVQAEADCLVRTSSSSTYTAAESIAPSTNGHGMWMENYGAQSKYKPISARLFMGLVSGMAMPATKSTWAADDTLYFRIFIESTTGGDSYQIVHVRAQWSISVTEVKR